MKIEIGCNESFVGSLFDKTRGQTKITKSLATTLGWRPAKAAERGHVCVVVCVRTHTHTHTHAKTQKVMSVCLSGLRTFVHAVVCVLASTNCVHGHLDYVRVSADTR